MYRGKEPVAHLLKVSTSFSRTFAVTIVIANRQLPAVESIRSLVKVLESRLPSFKVAGDSVFVANAGLVTMQARLVYHGRSLQSILSRVTIAERETEAGETHEHAGSRVISTTWWLRR